MVPEKVINPYNERWIGFVAGSAALANKVALKNTLVLHGVNRPPGRLRQLLNPSGTSILRISILHTSIVLFASLVQNHVRLFELWCTNSVDAQLILERVVAKAMDELIELTNVTAREMNRLVDSVGAEEIEMLKSPTITPTSLASYYISELHAAENADISMVASNPAGRPPENFDRTIVGFLPHVFQSNETMIWLFTHHRPFHSEFYNGIAKGYRSIANDMEQSV